MGAALALLAAIDRPDLVERLILLSPAGLPLTKPIPSSLVTWVRQVATGRFPLAPGGTVDRPGRARAEERAAARPRSFTSSTFGPSSSGFSANAGPVHGRGLHDRHDDPGLALPRARRR